MLKLSAKSIVSTPVFLIFLLPLLKLLFRPLKSESETVFMISFYDFERPAACSINFCFPKFSKPITAFP
jgi:hypothetical protein